MFLLYRLLFWTDIGTQPKIERSSSDGSDRRILIWSGIIRPWSVTVDIHNNLLYFTDSARETVESCDLEGNSRRILFSETNSHFYGVETFKVNSNFHIFFSNSIKYILTCSKHLEFYGQNIFELEFKLKCS